MTEQYQHQSQQQQSHSQVIPEFSGGDKSYQLVSPPSGHYSTGHHADYSNSDNMTNGSAAVYGYDSPDCAFYDQDCAMEMQQHQVYRSSCAMPVNMPMNSADYAGNYAQQQTNIQQQQHLLGQMPHHLGNQQQHHFAPDELPSDVAGKFR